MATGSDFARIGILGGGQLGRMMILAGAPLGFRFGVCTPRSDDPAARFADHLVVGELHDAAAIHSLCEWADVTTFEIEHINTEALSVAVEAGALVRPAPAALDTVNDKLTQRRLLAASGIPGPRFAEQPRSFPCVQKLRRGGYDGRGVTILRSRDTERLPGEAYYEDLIDFRRELAVVVARSVTGEVATYPVMEMAFDTAANICARVSAPARISSGVEERARLVAVAAVEAIDAVGVTAVELFETHEGTILVNELAPRPHNSGHLTIEACVTSQFEQHLRAIVGLPLGPTTLRSPAVMVNVLGAAGATGGPRLPAIGRLLARPDVHLHWYGKREVRPFRKMGHVTVLARTLDEAFATADEVEQLARVEGAGEEPA